MSGLIPGGAAGPRSPASTGTVSTGTASIHTLRIPNLSAAGSLRPATVLPAGMATNPIFCAAILRYLNRAKRFAEKAAVLFKHCVMRSLLAEVNCS